jgi:hypothetical protein
MSPADGQKQPSPPSAEDPAVNLAEQRRARKIAYVVTAYHVILIVAGMTLPIVTICYWQQLAQELRVFIHAVSFGVLGGTLTASRYVVYAVRHQEYRVNRVPWQIMTPIYSATLSWVGIIAVRAGLLTLGGSAPQKGEENVFFIMAFSFLVGLASESFIKRLIMSAEALFGERGDLEEENARTQNKTSNMRERHDRGPGL